jgi:hypothetical protein
MLYSDIEGDLGGSLGDLSLGAYDEEDEFAVGGDQSLVRGSVCVCFRVLVCARVHALLPDAVGAISFTLYLYTHLVA